MDKPCYGSIDLPCYFPNVTHNNEIHKSQVIAPLMPNTAF